MNLCKFILIIATAGLVATGASAQALARIDNEHTEVRVQSLSKSTVRYERTITLLSEKAAEFALFSVSLSTGEKLTSFSGRIVNAQGKEVRKLRKSDLVYTELSEALAEDGATYLYRYIPISYPLTLSYSYTLEASSGVPWIPLFLPQESTQVEVKKASYRLTVPAEMEGCSYHVRNMDDNVVRVLSNADGSTTYEVEVSDLPSIESEPLAIGLRERVANVEFVPRKFSFDGHGGSLASWDDFAVWQSSLLEGRDVLPDALCREIHAIADTLQTQKLKLAALYDYLGRHTRYVSIQLGIGGFQPMSVADVYSKGYGDCKALTNFMRAMLKEIGIDSYYTIISTNHRRMNNYASIGFFDHVVLKVVADGDDVWVECTAPDIPLGYVHGKIAGHDALVIDGSKAYIVTLPAYSSVQNRLQRKCRVDLTSDGEAKLSSAIRTNGFLFEPFMKADKMAVNEFRKEVADFFSSQTMQLDSFGVDIVRKPFSCPSFSTRLIHTVARYSRRTGNRLFVPITPFDNILGVPQKVESRTSSFEVKNGFSQIDTIDIVFPSGYRVESCPDEQNVESAFGSFMFRISQNDGGVKLIVEQRLEGGVFDADKYADFRSFVASINRLTAMRIVLVPKN